MKATEKKWEQALSALKTEYNDTIFSSWIADIRFLKHDSSSGILYLGVSSDLKKDRLEDRYKDTITEKSGGFFKPLSGITFLTPEEENALFGAESVLPADTGFSSHDMLDPRYTFDTFVEGDNNRFAYKAALAVAESADKPNPSYNPFFIYGGSGLGKTHLMNAVGHYILEKFPKLKVLYVSSESFVNDFVLATRYKNMEQFDKKYRLVDVLMIDDVQFISEKEKSIEEVFNIYNFLYNRRRQLVFSSDRPPKDLLGLDERLTSRLSSGIIADLKPYPLEVKVAILRNKALQQGLELTDDLLEVIDLIASKMKTNIRELEGAFNRVLAFSRFEGKKITKAYARVVLADIFDTREDQPTPDVIKKSVCKFYGIKVSDIESSVRKREFSFPRQIAMYLCREMIDISLPKIGEAFGGKDHTTVLHACEKIENIRKTDGDLEEVLKELEGGIRNN